MSESLDQSAIRQRLDLRRFPWIRPLLSAYARDFSSVASLFAGDPADPGAWRQTIARVSAAPRDRARMAAVLAGQTARRGSAADARRAAASLAEPGAVAVVTGQQAGLFGGPLYTLLKAVTAIQLARDLGARYQTTVVPLFWVAGEDHDWAEVKTARVLDGDLAVQDITLHDLPGAGAQPVASLTLDASVDQALATLEQVLAPTDFRADLLASLRAHYQAGASMSAAFAGWIDHLLGRHGLVVFECEDPAAKPLAADLFVHELQHADRTVDLVRHAAATMTTLGHAPQVEPTDDGVALFYVDGAGRHAIKRRNGEFVIAGRTHGVADLCAEAATHPERFSPSVILRPVVQDRLFPTVAYVGGPAEIAYQAQLGGVYREFGVDAPLLYSRASVTLVDSAAARFLERHTVALETLHAQDESVLNQLLAAQMPPALERALEAAAREATATLGALKTIVPVVDPTLSGAVDTTRDRMLDSLKQLHGKIIQASKRKDDTLRRQFLRTRALAFPAGHPQERALALPYFLNLYGPGLVDRLLDVLPLDTSWHYLLVL